MVDFTVTIVTGPSFQLLVEMLVPETHLVTEKIASGDRPSAGLGAPLPIVHVVLLERARRTEPAHAGQSDRFLDRRGRRLVGKDPSPNLGLLGSPRMPNTEGARNRAKHREVWEESADDRLDPFEARTEAPLHFRSDLRLVGLEFGYRRVDDHIGADPYDAVTIARPEHHSSRVGAQTVLAARPGLHRRTMAPRGMVAVAAEILGGEFPVARHDPFVHAANDFDAPLPAVKEHIQIPGHLAQIFEQGRRLGIEGRKEEALVIIQLRDWCESPAL